MRIALLSLVAILWGCAHQHTTPATSYPSTRPAQTSPTARVEVIFSDEEIRIIRSYYETHARHKNKVKGLPPGIAKNLARGKPLPPGIAKQYLPQDLRRQLPPPPDGYDRIVVAGKVLLIELATQIVRDVLTEAMLG
ncbi:MAG: anti-virulence regulator CigR family protein [Chromatiales bacterium]|jgi:Ni/Co efflux regulator RcnB|nr:anti-virulence regulator CigR family protein [Chromatiales bacterium]